MSSKGRGKPLDEGEWYPTPAAPVKLILERLAPDLGLTGKPTKKYPLTTFVCDPCSGDGAILRVVREMFPHVETVGYDIAPKVLPLFAYGQLQASQHAAYRLELADLNPRDALSDASWMGGRCELVITNPPFSKHREFIDRARKEASRHVLMLLRLAILESDERRDWLRASMPDVYVLPNRPSFHRPVGRKKGSTDSCAYAWFHWERGARVDPMRGLVEVL